MSSGKGRVLRLFSNIALKHGVVASAEDVAGFARVHVRVDVLVSAGTKVQLLLPTDDVRTYTPIPAPGGMVLLGWKNASGPGAAWIAGAKAKDEVAFVGPQRSLELERRPLIIVGDETSVAVAAAFAVERTEPVHAVIAATTPSGISVVAKTVGLTRLDTVGRAEHASAADQVRRALVTWPDAVVALTGGSELVTGVRELLRRAGVHGVKTKAYWIPGKEGLD